MTLPMWSNPRLHSEHTWRHANKMPILIQGFKDLKCIPRAERGEVWASVTNLLKEQRIVAEKPLEAKTAKPTKRKFALLAASSESDSEHKDHSVEESVRRYRADHQYRGLSVTVVGQICRLTQQAFLHCTELLGHTSNICTL